MTFFAVEDVQSLLSGPVSSLTPARLILVNYWLYPIQVFHFVAGRLFLTGHNGSGKSTALTAAITMLLDGDSSPSRLDPFGGTRRQLRYYLLGGPDAGFQEQGRRSYLALEFRTPEGEYQTIGLGLSASEGSSTIGKWGFWLSGRVQHEDGLDLVEGGQPLTERQLRERVTRWPNHQGGAGGEFAGGQGEYAGLVRRRIYGASEREFQDTLDLLLQVRGSKLGREVRPAQIAEILRRSLPPVSVSVTNKLAEGIERLDRHAQRLNLLETQTEAARSVAEATFHSALTGARFAFHRLQAAQVATDTAAAEWQAARDEQTGQQVALDAFRAEETDLTRETETLRVELEAVETQIGGQESALNATERKLNDVRGALEQNRSRLRTEKAREERAATRRQDTQDARASDERTLLGVQDALAARSWWADARSLPPRLAALNSAETALKTFERDTERLTERQQASLSAAERAETARLTLTQKTGALEEVLSDSAEELLLRAGALNFPDDALPAYRLSLETGVELADAFTHLQPAATELLNAARDAQDTARQRVRELQADLLGLQERFDTLQAQTGAEPPLPAARTQALNALQAVGIDAQPFYRLVKPVTANADLGKLEGALLASGLLTALTVPAGREEAALNILSADGLADALLLPMPRQNQNLSGLLAPEEDAPDGIQAILEGISTASSVQSPATISPQSWQNGVLTGSSPDEGLRFLGAAARERERQRQLALLQEGLEVVSEGLDTAQQALAGLSTQLTLLETELEFLRHAPDLLRERRAAARERDEARHTLALRSEAHEQALAALQDAQERARDAAKALDTAFAPLQLGGAAGRESLEAAQLDYRAAQTEWAQVATLEERLARAEVDLHDLQEQLAEHAQEIQRLEGERTGLEAQRDALSAQLTALRTQHDAPDAAKLRAKLNELRQRDRELERAGRELLKKVTAAQERLRMVSERLPVLDAAAARAQATLEQARTSLEQARALHPRLSDEAAPDLTPPTTEREMRETEFAMWDAFDRARPLLEAPDSYHPARTPSGPSFHLQGEKAGPDALYQHLAGELDAARQLLTDEEARVFHNELIRELVEELDSRQRQATAWVAGIRRTLQDLHFHDEHLDLLAKIQPPAGESAEILAALIDTRVDPNHQPDSWWQAVQDEVRRVVHALQARQDAELSFAQALERTLDYREWLQFTFHSVTPAGKREITDRTFAQRSGGERSAVLYTFLFAALSARFDQLGPRTPRLLGLDEAFAGMDLTNIGALYRIMHELKLSWIATSQNRIDLSPELKAAATYQLIRVTTPHGSSVGSLAYVWDGSTAHEGRKYGLE